MKNDLQTLRKQIRSTIRAARTVLSLGGLEVDDTLIGDLEERSELASWLGDDDLSRRAEAAANLLNIRAAEMALAKVLA